MLPFSHDKILVLEGEDRNAESFVLLMSFRKYFHQGFSWTYSTSMAILIQIKIHRLFCSRYSSIQKRNVIDLYPMYNDSPLNRLVFGLIVSRYSIESYNTVEAAGLKQVFDYILHYFSKLLITAKTADILCTAHEVCVCRLPTDFVRTPRGHLLFTLGIRCECPQKIFTIHNVDIGF